jgi:hypothetical protein
MSVSTLFGRQDLCQNGDAIDEGEDSIKTKVIFWKKIIVLTLQLYLFQKEL